MKKRERIVWLEYGKTHMKTMTHMICFQVSYHREAKNKREVGRETGPGKRKTSAGAEASRARERAQSGT